MGEHNKSGWMRQRWDAFRFRGGRENEDLLKKDPREEEVQTLRGIELPPFIGPQIREIPDFALNSSIFEAIKDLLVKREKLPYHLGQMLANATISFITTNPDHIAAILARIPETSYQEPSQRPLIDRYAFSPQQVLTIRDRLSQSMRDGQQQEVDITFVADPPDSQKHLIWKEPIIVMMKTPQP